MPFVEGGVVDIGVWKECRGRFQGLPVEQELEDFGWTTVIDTNSVDEFTMREEPPTSSISSTAKSTWPAPNVIVSPLTFSQDNDSSILFSVTVTNMTNTVFSNMVLHIAINSHDTECMSTSLVLEPGKPQTMHAKLSRTSFQGLKMMHIVAYLVYSHEGMIISQGHV